MRLTIHRALPSDSGVLAELEAACFDEPWTARAVMDALCDPKYSVVLAASEGEFVAYALGWSVGDEAELARVGVLPQWRGRGFGEQVLRALVQNFRDREVQEVFLEVRAGNARAQRLYERCGFERIGVRRKYYSDGEDAIVMHSVPNAPRAK